MERHKSQSGENIFPSFISLYYDEKEYFVLVVCFRKMKEDEAILNFEMASDFWKCNEN